MRLSVLLCVLCVSVVSVLSAQETRVPDAAQFVGPPDGKALTGTTLDRETIEVSALLRCPVCQGLSVADSPSVMATNMKQQVRELLARGYTREQILTYFERAYGEFVLLRPKFGGLNTVVWILPLFLLLLGAGIVLAKVKRGVPVVAQPEPTDDPYVKRVRELAGGE